MEKDRGEVPATPGAKKRHGKPYTCATCGRGYSLMGPIMACGICWKAELKRLGINPKRKRRTKLQEAP